jgi:hypothetical protein
MLSACSQGEEEDRIEVGPGQQTEKFCEASCTRDLECEGMGTLSGCRSACEDYVTGLGNFRPEAVEIVANCILDISCARFYADEAFVPCWERAEREVEANQTTRRFCQAWSSRWFECGGRYSIEECENDWDILSAGYLDRISGCMMEPCEAIEACALSVEGSSG